jgi:hypothetical protein
VAVEAVIAAMGATIPDSVRGPYSWVVLAAVDLAAEAAEVDLVAEDLVIGVVLAVAVDSMEAVPAEVGNQPAFPLGIF